MTLWEIVNNYVGFSYVRVYAWASTERRALELAREKFGEAGMSHLNLSATALFKSSDPEFCTRPSSEGWETEALPCPSTEGT